MQRNLKGRFIAAIGHVPAGHESAAEVFDRLRETSPDVFPVPRSTELDSVTKTV